MTKLWMRHEQRPDEHRAPLVPADAAELVSSGIEVTVEHSPHRTFPIEEYLAVGATAAPVGSWRDAVAEVHTPYPFEAVQPPTIAGENFEVYPNRDGVPFVAQYGVPAGWRLRTFVRGTLRLAGWQDAWQRVFAMVKSGDAEESAMARCVSLPVACGVNRILSGRAAPGLACAATTAEEADEWLEFLNGHGLHFEFHERM
ncbi:hypothetical protein FDG2_4403 [Candidatus Protofrankia californiensis]|uniref:Alanine dehydrogenase/pyridine nucleotide transhydrogenase N-terminal domain-containing protein n=1 Tax=Candidatus Protofrankia californiensis TaxID=1839754 RepID=A0A1C3P5D2_9ACTN|nr:hypothetical protein FDG2_4403 [Candidatus Protofrankia californiensis]